MRSIFSIALTPTDGTISFSDRRYLKRSISTNAGATYRNLSILCTTQTYVQCSRRPPGLVFAGEALSFWYTLWGLSEGSFWCMGRGFVLVQEMQGVSFWYMPGVLFWYILLHYLKSVSVYFKTKRKRR